MSEPIELEVNGTTVSVEVDPDDSLLSVLRDELDLRGSRFGCGQGLCGACIVTVDGTVVYSCDTPMWSVAGKRVGTVEGLSDDDGQLHPVQQAVLDRQAAQCGYCTAGILVNAVALLARNPHPDAETVAEELDRNLCRCGVQRRVVDAIVAAGQDEGGRSA